MNVVFISRVQMNPYVSLLAAAMEQAAPGIATAVLDDLSLRWLWRTRVSPKVNVLHLHWAELLYASTKWQGAWWKWLRFVAGVLLAKISGIRVVYTVHNIEQHEGQRSFLNRLTNALLFRVADVVHVHDEHARQAIAARFGRRHRVVVIPHGNYLSYPNTCTRAEARARLGIAEHLFVYLFLGQLRPYKGLEDLLTAFSRLPDQDCLLLIAGHVHEPAYGNRIQSLAAADRRVILRLGYVPPEDLQYLMKASDIVVLPYRQVTTSGAAILAFSFGKPVIAPRLGDFPNLVGDQRGLLYEAANQDSLLSALHYARRVDLVVASEAAKLLAQELDWVSIARQHLRAYERVATG